MCHIPAISGAMNDQSDCSASPGKPPRERGIFPAIFFRALTCRSRPPLPGHQTRMMQELTPENSVRESSWDGKKERPDQVIACRHGSDR